jgi:hypothetical protein
MSLPPLPYQSRGVYPPIPRPTMLTVLAVLGIVFGGMGVLCLGFNTLFSLFAFTNPALTRGVQSQPMTMRVYGLLITLCALVLAGVLLFASIGCLALKPMARGAIVAWSVVDIAFDVLRMLLSLFVFIPAISRRAATQPNIGTGQFAVLIKLGVALGVLIWLNQLAYAVLLFVYFRKPEVAALFEQPPQYPGQIVSPPPPPM